MKAKVLAAKNMPSRLLPVVTESLSAMSATIACGRIPKIAMGSAANTISTKPCAAAERKGILPIKPV